MSLTVVPTVKRISEKMAPFSVVVSLITPLLPPVKASTVPLAVSSAGLPVRVALSGSVKATARLIGDEAKNAAVLFASATSVKPAVVPQGLGGGVGSSARRAPTSPVV